MNFRMTAVSAFLFFAFTLVSISFLTGCVSASWKGTLEKELPRLGHRNFVVVADSAYPLQSASGIQTVYTGADHIEVLEYALAEVLAAPHVNPIIYMDSELKYIRESDAPGISDIRLRLKETLRGAEVRELPHMETIRKLDEASALFNVLILKTDLTLPYTSVFMELDCGYWDGAKEEKLRKAIEK